MRWSRKSWTPSPVPSACREMKQKMCNPNILRSYIKFYQPPNSGDPFLPFSSCFLVTPTPRLCLQSQMLVWPGTLKVVSTISLISITPPVIFQLARRSPSCQSVTNGCPVPCCSGVGHVRDYDLCNGAE